MTLPISVRCPCGCGHYRSPNIIKSHMRAARARDEAAEECVVSSISSLCHSCSPTHHRALNTAPTLPREADREPERGTESGDDTPGSHHVASPHRRSPRSPSPAAASDPEDEYEDASGLGHFDMEKLFREGPTEAELETAALDADNLPSPPPSRQSGRKRKPTEAAVLSLEQQEQRTRRSRLEAEEEVLEVVHVEGVFFMFCFSCCSCSCGVESRGERCSSNIFELKLLQCGLRQASWSTSASFSAIITLPPAQRPVVPTAARRPLWPPPPLPHTRAMMR
jgi:hypothetical protein